MTKFRKNGHILKIMNHEMGLCDINVHISCILVRVGYATSFLMNIVAVKYWQWISEKGGANFDTKDTFRGVL